MGELFCSLNSVLYQQGKLFRVDVVFNFLIHRYARRYFMAKSHI